MQSPDLRSLTDEKRRQGRILQFGLKELFGAILLAGTCVAWWRDHQLLVQKAKEAEMEAREAKIHVAGLKSELQGCLADKRLRDAGIRLPRESTGDHLEAEMQRIRDQQRRSASQP